MADLAQADPFVGRDRELRAADLALADALSGRGRLLLLAGEAGIGKTRLAGEIGARARHAGAEVLSGWGWEGEGAPAFWPWVQVVRAHLAGCDAQDAAADLGDGAANIAQAIADVRLRLPALPEPRALEADQARFRLFDSLTRFFAAAARRRPLVLLLDDLHWADTPSLRLLQFLAREMEELPLLVIAAYRDNEVDTEHPLSGVLAELPRARVSERLALTGLSAAEIGRFVELAQGRTVSADALAVLQRRTAGNPLFLGELLRLALSEGGLDQSGGVAALAERVPPSVAEVIGRRLRRLTPACRALLDTAAVIGLEFDLLLLNRVLATHTAPSAESLSAIDEAVATHLLEERGGRKIAFVHPLIRDTLYGLLSPTERARLHLRVGIAMESCSPDAVDQHAAELSQHFAAAAFLGDGQNKALLYARRAGERALAQLAYEDAVAHFQRALHALDARGALDPQQRCELLLDLGDAQSRCGDHAASRTSCLASADLAREHRLPDQLGRAALGFGWFFDPGVVDQVRIAVVEEALDLLPTDASALRVRLTARLSLLLSWADGAEARCAKLVDDAVAMARQLGEPAPLAFALNAWQFVHWQPSETRERLTAARELVQLADRTGEQELALQSRQWLVTALLETGDIAAADREISLHAALAASLHQPVYRWFAALWKAMRALLDGRLTEVEKLAEEALEIGLRAEPRNAENTYLTQIFFLRSEQCRLEEVAGAAAASFTQGDLPGAERDPFAAHRRCGLALLFSDTGRHEEARSLFNLLAADGFAMLWGERGALSAWVAAVEVCYALADVQRAAQLYRMSSPLRHLCGVTGMGICWHGSIAHSLGLLSTVMGEWDIAEAHFVAALELHQRIGARPLLARTQYAYADLLQRRSALGDSEKAAGLLDDALTSARACGMLGLGMKIETLRATGATGPGLGARREADRSSATASSPCRTGVFRNEGHYWTIEYDGATLHLKDSRGMQYLAYLLRHSGREFYALDLYHTNGDESAEGHLPVDRRLEFGKHATAAAQEYAALDVRAKAEYRHRLIELREELDEAERLNDRGRTERARREIDMLGAELAAAVGLGGRDRRTGTSAERARSAVTKRIRSSIKQIAALHPGLGHHLSVAVTTGFFCVYLSYGDQIVSWTF